MSIYIHILYQFHIYIISYQFNIYINLIGIWCSFMQHIFWQVTIKFCALSRILGVKPGRFYCTGGLGKKGHKAANSQLLKYSEIDAKCIYFHLRTDGKN